MLAYCRLVLLAFVSSILMAACETAGPAIGTADVDEMQARTISEYYLGAGDQLRVIVFGEEELSGEFVVDGGGSISMPLVGEIRAAGTTVRQFQRSLETALRQGYLTDPRVSAEVLNFRPFYILGEVEASGEYPYSDGLTVLNAVATAGGFTYRANQKVVYIKRAGAVNEEVFPLTASTPVEPGDTLRIAERFF